MDDEGVDEVLASRDEHGVVGSEGGAGEPEKEDHGLGEVDVELEDAQDDLLHLDDVAGLVGVLGEVDELGEFRRVVLLHLGGDPQGGHAHQLQLVRVDVALVQDVVQQSDRQVQALLGELQVVLNL